MTQPYTEWVRQRYCTSKRRHTSQYDANVAVLAHWRAGKWAWRYECAHCGGWHLTSDETLREEAA